MPFLFRPLFLHGQDYVCAVLLLVVALGLSRSLGTFGILSKRVTDSSGCQSFAATLVEAVKAHDNALIIRNFLPSGPHRRASHSQTDPFCTEAESKACDSLDHAPNHGSSSPGTVLRNSQNVRNAANWALSIYNQNQPAICTDSGLVYERKDLDRFQELVKDAKDLPRFVDKLALKITKNSGNPCEIADMGLNGSDSFRAEFTVWYKAEGAQESAEARCTAGMDLRFDPDRVAPSPPWRLTELWNHIFAPAIDLLIRVIPALTQIRLAYISTFDPLNPEASFSVGA